MAAKLWPKRIVSQCAYREHTWQLGSDGGGASVAADQTFTEFLPETR